MFQRFNIHSRLVRRSGITFYGAHDKLLGREVWLWRLFEFGERDDRPTDEQLKTEKAPLVVLRHRGIVTLHDIEADPDGVVALLEPAAGEPLDEWMTRGPVDAGDFNQIAESCLEALSAAADAGLPHGALEPGLIFTGKSEDGRMHTSLAGFGIARLVTKLHGGDHETSESLDVWTLGGILHALLTGEQIEEGQVIRPPHEARPGIPVPISEWVMRLLVDDANMRPQTAADALALLRQALAPAPVGQIPASHPSMQPAQWPAGYAPNLHPPVWNYPQVPVWHMPPAQWTQPYDPAQAAQQPQMWQQVAWYPWPGQMPADPYQGQLAAQQPEPPPVPARNPNAPKPRLPASPKSAESADATHASIPAKPKVSSKRWVGPAISLAAAAVVMWYFRDVFAPVFRRETWQGMLGDNVRIKWPGDHPPAATPPAAPATAAAPVSVAKSATIVPAKTTPAAKAPAKKAAPKPKPTDPKPSGNKNAFAKPADQKSLPASR